MTRRTTVNLSDDAYAAHYEMVGLVNQLIAEHKFGHASELYCVRGSEYRTVFVQEGTGIAVLINTQVDTAGTVLYLGRALDSEALYELPMDDLHGRRIRFQSVNEEAVTQGLHRLGIIPAPESKRRRTRDAVEVGEDGIRILNYEKLRRRVPGVEENTIKYGRAQKA